MSERRVERRLAAILAADVVGYSRPMSADEVRTLRALEAQRKDLTDPVIAAGHGRFFKTIGDGLLVEFPSAVAAVSATRSSRAASAARPSASASPSTSRTPHARPCSGLHRLLAGTVAVTPGTALRLSRLFGSTPEFWLRMQQAYDLWHERRAMAAEVQAIQPATDTERAA